MAVCWELKACIKKYEAVTKGVEVYNPVGKRVKQKIPGEGFQRRLVQAPVTDASFKYSDQKEEGVLPQLARP